MTSRLQWINTMKVLAAVCLLAGSVFGQTTKPSDDKDDKPVPEPVRQLKVRAIAAFDRGDYAVALPMLKRLGVEFKDQPKRLGPIEERIRVCYKNLAKSAASPQTAPALQPAPADLIPTTPESRKPHPAPVEGKVAEMTIKELGNFDYDQEKGGNIPKDVERLAGSTVRLHGFMIPMDQAENITQFALVPSLFACCFGQPPQLQHTIVVNCPKGKAVTYSPDEVMVEGKLNVEEKKDEGYVVSIFQLSAMSVKPAPK